MERCIVKHKEEGHCRESQEQINIYVMIIFDFTFKAELVFCLLLNCSRVSGYRVYRLVDGGLTLLL